MELVTKNMYMLQKKCEAVNQITFDEDLNVPDVRAGPMVSTILALRMNACLFLLILILDLTTLFPTDQSTSKKRSLPP